jgi:hypothetical protein
MEAMPVSSPTATRSGVLRFVRPWSVFLALTALVFFYRYWLLMRLHSPATVDSGNWLAFGKQLFGKSARSDSLHYPPVVPTLVYLSTSVVGVTKGVAGLVSLAACAPAIGIYISLRRSGLAWEAIVPAGLILCSSPVGEAAAWGGLPQLIGLGIVPVFLSDLDDVMLRCRPRRVAEATLLLAVLLLTSHFVSILAVAGAGILMAFRLTQFRRKGFVAAVKRWRVVLILLSPFLLVVPTYFDLLRRTGNSTQLTPNKDKLRFGSLPEMLHFLTRDLKIPWYGIFVLAALTPIVCWKRRTATIMVIPMATLLAALGLGLGTGEGRFAYVFPMAAVLFVGAWLNELAHSPHVQHRVIRILFNGALAGMCLLQLVTGARFFRGQRDYYAILRPGIYEAMRWIDDVAPRDRPVGVDRVAEAPLGWWFEGLTGREALYASPLRWLSFPDEIRRATVANKIYSDEFPNDVAMQEARTAGVTYLLVVIHTPGYSQERMDKYLSAHPEAAVHRNSDAIVLRVPGS